MLFWIAGLKGIICCVVCSVSCLCPSLWAGSSSGDWFLPLFKTFRMNLEKLSKPELLTLFSILEGELEARDLVIEALKVWRERERESIYPMLWAISLFYVDIGVICVKNFRLNMVAHTFTSGAWEAEAGRSLSLRPSSSIEQFTCQPRLYRPCLK